MQSSCCSSARKDLLILSGPGTGAPPEHAFRKLRCLQCGELWHRQGHGRKQRQTVFAVWDTRLSLCGPILCPVLQLWRQAQ